MKRAFLICPVRNATDDERAQILAFVRTLQGNGFVVHWPERDTDQVDSIGLRICTDNRRAIADADIVYVWWNGTSSGSLFDLGIAFGLEKPVRIANVVTGTDGKSFSNVLIALDAETARCE